MRLRKPQKEDGAAIVEFILMLPIFAMFICLIVEIGGLLIVYAAVDDAAYTVSHAYSVNPTLSENALAGMAASSGALKNATIGTDLTVKKTTNGTAIPEKYVHHLPNDITSEIHTAYHEEATFTVTFKAPARTIMGTWMTAGENEYIISAESSCVVDRTSQNNWWAS